MTSSVRKVPRRSASRRSAERTSGSASGWSANTWPQPSRVRRSSRTSRSTGGTLPAARTTAPCAPASTNRAKAACCWAASSAWQSSRAIQSQCSGRLPGRRHGGFEPGDRGALLLRPLDHRMQQMRLAAARRPPEVDRRRPGGEHLQVRQRRGIRAGQEVLEGARRLRPDRQRNLLHPSASPATLIRRRGCSCRSWRAAAPRRRRSARSSAAPAARRRSRTGGRRRTARRSR